MRESLTIWALQELMGHYVNFRKSRGLNKVKPETTRLYAVCTKYPRALERELGLEEIEPGVYETRALGKTIRVIVLSRVGMEDRNAIWDMFSARRNAATYGMEHYRWKKRDCSSVVNELYWMYKKEGIDMPYTLKQFKKDLVLDHLDELEPEERLRGLKAEQVLSKYKPEERLRGMSRRQLEAYLRKMGKSRAKGKNGR